MKETTSFEMKDSEPGSVGECQRTDAIIFDYYLDVSEGRENAEMKQHIAECQKCRDTLQYFLDAARAVIKPQTASESSSIVPALSPLMPKKIGEYEVVGPLGEGGMGTVYKAYDPGLQRHIAIKVMREALVDNRDLRQRFMSEARLTAKLSHPNIVHVHNIGQHEEHAYIAMELVEGQPLTALIRKRLLDVTSSLLIFRQLLEGIKAAHAADILHRDIKPSNIMVAGEAVKVLDFGLAKELHVSAVTSLTTEGAVLGTLAYMAPEAAMGKKATVRSDLYSAGLVLYEMLTGAAPFAESSNPLRLIERIKNDRLVMPSQLNPTVPPYLDAIVQKMCAKQPEQRYVSAEAVLADLDKKSVAPSSELPTARTQNPTSAGQSSMWRTAGLAAVLVLSVVVARYWVGQRQRLPDQDDPVAARNSHPDDVGKKIPPPMVVRDGVVMDESFPDASSKRPGSTLPASTSGDQAVGSVTRRPEPPANMKDDGFAKEAPSLLPNEQIKLVAAKLKELNPGCFEGAREVFPPELVSIQDGEVSEVSLHTEQPLTDISPLKVFGALRKLRIERNRKRDDVPSKLDFAPLSSLPIESLTLQGIDVADPRLIGQMPKLRELCLSQMEVDLYDVVGPSLEILSLNSGHIRYLAALQKSKVRVLRLGSTDVRDISPLASVPLSELSLELSLDITDLSPLQNMKLSKLSLIAMPIADISVLSKMPLRRLSLGGCTVISDLSPLKQMSFESLDLRWCSSLRDISPLRECKIKQLDISFTSLTDLAVLRDMNLEELSFTVENEKNENVEILKSLPSLKRINNLPTAEFWKRQEALKNLGGSNRR